MADLMVYHFSNTRYESSANYQSTVNPRQTDRAPEAMTDWIEEQLCSTGQRGRSSRGHLSCAQQGNEVTQAALNRAMRTQQQRSEVTQAALNRATRTQQQQRSEVTQPALNRTQQQRSEVTQPAINRTQQQGSLILRSTGQRGRSSRGSPER